MLSQAHLRCLRNVTEQKVSETKSDRIGSLAQRSKNRQGLLAFLRPLLREASEISSSWKRRSKKRYWANVSDVFFQSEDAARKLLRRAKREFGLSLDRRPRLENLLDSSIENNVSAGAFQCSFTVKFEKTLFFKL